MSVVLAEIDNPVAVPVPPDKAASRKRWWALLGVLVAWAVLGTILKGRNTQFLPVSELTDFQEWLNTLRNWIEQAKFDGNPLFVPIDWISSAINEVVEQLQRLFVSDPSRPADVAIVGYAGVVALAGWLAYALAGIRIAIGTLVAMLLFGYLGFWEDSIDTLIVTGISVLLCVVIGLPLGVWMSRSERATAAIKPVLDVMQTMPSFAYLGPLVLIFGIGNPGAVVCTIVYALPPLVRISAHGLRNVSPTTIEATTSMGSTSTQLLNKVQLPMARRTIIVGLNQTMMAALSIATIAAFIAGPGLGRPIVRALGSLNVGVAFVSGMCIVIMAIMLDRATVTAGERSEVSARRNVNQGSRRAALAVSGALVIVAIYLSHTQLRWSQFPESDLGRQIASWVNTSTDNFVDTFGGVTRWLNDTVTNLLLNPMQELLANVPWWLAAGGILAIAGLFGGIGTAKGVRALAGSAVCVTVALSAGLWAAGSLSMSWWLFWGTLLALLFIAARLGAGGALLPTSVCIAIIFGVGLWNATMVTLAMTLVATVMVMALGVVIGVWMGRSRRADSSIRPFLDGLQTMPSLVYLVPALALFPPGRFLAIVAAVLYAAPVSIKIAADGIRGVSPTTVEAAQAAGSSRWQMISKVQLPMSKGSLVLAANQGLLFVLSMVVIGGLVGGGGLGFLVINGFAQREDYGKGLAAGIAITALGVMLDRITVHTAARYGRADSV